MTCKWLITRVIVSPLRIGLFPFQMGFSWLINGVTNHLLTGMILQVDDLRRPFVKALFFEYAVEMHDELAH